MSCELYDSGHPGWLVARLAGAIDLSNVEDLGKQLEESVSNRARGVILDLSAVTYLDSTGMQLIYRLARQLGDRQQVLRLIVPPGARISRVLALAGVGSVAEVLPDLAHFPTGEEENS